MATKVENLRSRHIGRKAQLSKNDIVNEHHPVGTLIKSTIRGFAMVRDEDGQRMELLVGEEVTFK